MHSRPQRDPAAPCMEGHFHAWRSETIFDALDTVYKCALFEDSRDQLPTLGVWGWNVYTYRILEVLDGG